jgi:DNA-binding response OmpR family regulator
MIDGITTILVVDDNEAGLYATSRTLRQEGFEVREASTGQDALRIAMEQPDLVVLDVNLPDMEGFEVCKRIKENPATALIPVLHLSATRVDPASRVIGLDGGADGYLIQPVDSSELVATIRALLRMRAAEKRASELRDVLAIRIQELEAATAHIRMIQGILPICMHCRRIRDDRQAWRGLEDYIREHSDAQFSHGLCPECSAKHYSEFSEKQ